MALTTDQKAQQLASAGYNGPTDPASIEAAYARTATASDAAANPPNIAGIANTDALNTTPTDNTNPSSNDAGAQAQAQAQVQAAQLADQQAQRALAASTAANAQTFAEQVREFNANHDLAIQQFGVSVGGLTGQYNGQPTLAAQQQAFNNAATQANITGWFAPPGTATGAGASGGAGPLGQYPPGTVVRTSSNQFGVVGQNGTMTPGDFSNPAIYQAIQTPGSIFTVPDALFAQAAAQSQAAPASTTGNTSGPPTSFPTQTLAGQLQQANLSGQYNGQPTEAARQFNATTSGLLNGQPTAAYQQELANITGQFNGQPTEAARQFNVNTESDLAKLASSLTGPADYFKYLNALNGGQSIISNLTTGKAMPAGGAPVGATQPQSLQNILSGLGLGGGGGTSLPSGSTTSNGQVSLPFGQGALPQMNQIQPTAWNSMSPSAQQFIGGAYAAAGYDPSDIARSIASETPATGAAPSSGSSSTNFAGTGSQSLFG